ncbi:MAG: hypothetical protein JWR37_3405 [Mycobacterium sp.]|nr:hypothetical protein [Mycobacterium sp.]
MRAHLGTGPLVDDVWRHKGMPATGKVQPRARRSLERRDFVGRQHIGDLGQLGDQLRGGVSRQPGGHDAVLNPTNLVDEVGEVRSAPVRRGTKMSPVVGLSAIAVSGHGFVNVVGSNVITRIVCVVHVGFVPTRWPGTSRRIVPAALSISDYSQEVRRR